MIFNKSSSYVLFVNSESASIVVKSQIFDLQMTSIKGEKKEIVLE